MNHESQSAVGANTVFVIPVGPACRVEFVGDTIDSIQFFAPRARIILVDDTCSAVGAELEQRYRVSLVKAPAHGLFGNLYLNLSAGFQEALSRPFKILVRLDTDALIAGDDFEKKALDRFGAEHDLGSLGSFRIGYDRIATRDPSWAKHRILVFLALRSWRSPRAAFLIARLLLKSRRHGYQLGESIMGGVAVYRYEAVAAMNDAGLLGRSELSLIGLQEDHVFGLCLLSLGYQLGEFGDRYDDLPMGVHWIGLPASPQELMERGKSMIHSTKSFEELDEAAIRSEFRSARQHADDGEHHG
jgi:hypothetical protein